MMLIIDLSAHIIKDLTGLLPRACANSNEFFTDSHRGCSTFENMAGISAIPLQHWLVRSMGVLNQESIGLPIDVLRNGVWLRPTGRKQIKATVMVMIVRMEYMFFWVKS